MVKCLQLVFALMIVIIIINYYSLCSHELDYLDQKAPDYFQKDVVVGDKTSDILHLQLLAMAKTWYMGGTFKIVNHPWQQMSFCGADLSNWDAELSECRFVLVPKCLTQVPICPCAEVSRILVLSTAVCVY